MSVVLTISEADRSLSNDDWALGVRLFDAIAVLFTAVESRMSLPRAAFELWYNGRALQDAQRLADAGIEDDSLILLVRRREEPQVSSTVPRPFLRPVGGAHWPQELETALAASNRGLAREGPRLASDGEGGTYFLPGDSGDGTTVACFKPRDEESGAPGNPKRFVGEFGTPGLRAGLVSGESYAREVAAYMLDHDGLAGVPATALAEGAHSGFNNGGARVMRKLGSIQVFIPDAQPADAFGPSVLPLESVQAIALLDMRLLNLDRNADNLLVVQDGETAPGASGRPTLRLVPIDHGCTIPGDLGVAWVDWVWLGWPQLRAPLSPRLRRYVAALDVERDVRRLRAAFGTALQPQCYTTMRLTHLVLQRAVAAGLTLADVADALCRTGELTSPSLLERMVSTARLGATAVAHNSRVRELPSLQIDGSRAVGREGPGGRKLRATLSGAVVAPPQVEAPARLSFTAPSLQGGTAAFGFDDSSGSGLADLNAASVLSPSGRRHRRQSVSGSFADVTLVETARAVEVAATANELARPMMAPVAAAAAARAASAIPGEPPPRVQVVRLSRADATRLLLGSSDAQGHMLSSLLSDDFASTDDIDICVAIAWSGGSDSVASDLSNLCVSRPHAGSATDPWLLASPRRILSVLASPTPGATCLSSNLSNPFEATSSAPKQPFTDSARVASIAVSILRCRQSVIDDATKLSNDVRVVSQRRHVMTTAVVVPARLRRLASMLQSRDGAFPSSDKVDGGAAAFGDCSTVDGMLRMAISTALESLPRATLPSDVVTAVQCDRNGAPPQIRVPTATDDNEDGNHSSSSSHSKAWRVMSFTVDALGHVVDVSLPNGRAQLAKPATAPTKPSLHATLLQHGTNAGVAARRAASSLLHACHSTTAVDAIADPPFGAPPASTHQKWLSVPRSGASLERSPSGRGDPDCVDGQSSSRPGQRPQLSPQSLPLSRVITFTAALERLHEFDSRRARTGAVVPDTRGTAIPDHASRSAGTSARHVPNSGSVSDETASAAIAKASPATPPTPLLVRQASLPEMASMSPQVDAPRNSSISAHDCPLNETLVSAPAVAAPTTIWDSDHKVVRASIGAPAYERAFLRFVERQVDDWVATRVNRPAAAQISRM